MTDAATPAVSICIVSLDCRKVLEDCLDSLRACPAYFDWEVILVDNNSTDGTAGFVGRRFPEVKMIANRENVGFTKATNQALERSTGTYLLWLNPDTVVLPDSIPQLVSFLERTPQAGIVGPRVLNADGSFQAQCRRGLPTPAASLAYKLGFNRLFPRSRLAGQYLLSHLPEGDAAQVTAVSGCCLMARREVLRGIGPLDEAIFGFGEDIDWCFRAIKAGWEVWYWPKSVITHLKGRGGAHSKPYKKLRAIHQAMWVFYSKHLSADYSRPVSALVRLGIWASLALSVTVFTTGRLFRRVLPHRSAG